MTMNSVLIVEIDPNFDEPFFNGMLLPHFVSIRTTRSASLTRECSPSSELLRRSPILTSSASQRSPPPSTLIVTICFCAFLDAYEGVLPQGLFEFTFDPSGNRPISRRGFHHRTASRNRTISRGIERKFKQALRQNAFVSV
jgi:hypothetical protein